MANSPYSNTLKYLAVLLEINSLDNDYTTDLLSIDCQECNNAAFPDNNG